ncbi:bifunctional AP-4-A phosphorylase/ADP sulfurylase [Actinomortierella ambigua]|nr:bifunctional AP-4-A phosphorylase/ADP sulfurylase [Actinomortierella ambigua]
MVAFRDDFEALLKATYSSALKSGDLIFTPSEIHHSIETEFNVEFDITYAPALAKKPHGLLEKVEEDQASTGASRPSTPVAKNVSMTNPFLPHSPALYVTDAGDKHKILLNKFCIVPEHFLIVTKDTSEDEELDMLVKTYISLMDAMHESLREEYATQHHLTEEERMQAAGGVSSLSYNWIMTREFMMIAPRRQEGYGPLNINSLGFAGMVLAKTADELKAVKKLGVIGIVSKTGFQVKNAELARAEEAKKQEEQAYLDERMAHA